MITDLLTKIATKHPKKVILVIVFLTLLLLTSFTKLKTDTDPVHMLEQSNPAVILYNQIKKEFNLNDIVALGIISKDGSNLFNKDSLNRIKLITDEIKAIKDSENGDSEILVTDDIMSVSTVDDIILTKSKELLVTPIMRSEIKTDAEALKVQKILNSNPLLSGKLTSIDGTAIGIFMPLKNGKKDRAFYLSKRINEIAKKHLNQNEEFHFAGLPVAETTFGAEMFVQMGVYAPLAGLVIFLLLFYFFRSAKVVAAPMILGVTAVIWSMAGLILTGNVVHIMSSMIPIFLMPIAVLDSIHMLSSLAEQMEKKEKKQAINDVMKELFKPMLYTSLTTSIGFISLATTGIPPVMVFGVTIGLGVLFTWLLTMLFIPAYTMLISKDALDKLKTSSVKEPAILSFVKNFQGFSMNNPKKIIFSTILIVIVSIIGVNKIVINDNPVRWFKNGHKLRLADVEMNKKLAGTYMANILFSFPEEKIEKSTEEIDDFAEVDDKKYITVRSPLIVKYIDKVSKFLMNEKDHKEDPLIGGITAFPDILRKIGKVAFNDERIPETVEKVSQYIFLFESGDTKKGKDLWKILERTNSIKTQSWVYFKNGDNQHMSEVMKKLDIFIKNNPPPSLKNSNGDDVQLEVHWSGLTHINNVWQSEMVSGMMEALISSFVIVFLMMSFLFKSPKLGFISMLPLSITILFIYGLIGYTGKFYDMPIAVLSSLTLGLSVDFSIHFIEHARQHQRKTRNFFKTMDELFQGTAQSIWKNVLVISIGFCPLFFAGLVPYITVGFFFFLIMIVSGISTLILMPAIFKLTYNYLPGFKND